MSSALREKRMRPPAVHLRVGPTLRQHVHRVLPEGQRLAARPWPAIQRAIWCSQATAATSRATMLACPRSKNPRSARWSCSRASITQDHASCGSSSMAAWKAWISRESRFTKWPNRWSLVAGAPQRPGLPANPGREIDPCDLVPSQSSRLRPGGCGKQLRKQRQRRAGVIRAGPHHQRQARHVGVGISFIPGPGPKGGQRSM
jgi:hypothetical protein